MLFNGISDYDALGAQEQLGPSSREAIILYCPIKGNETMFLETKNTPKAAGQSHDHNQLYGKVSGLELGPPGLLSLACPHFPLTSITVSWGHDRILEKGLHFTPSSELGLIPAGQSGLDACY